MSKKKGKTEYQEFESVMSRLDNIIQKEKMLNKKNKKTSNNNSDDNFLSDDGAYFNGKKID